MPASAVSQMRLLVFPQARDHPATVSPRRYHPAMISDQEQLFHVILPDIVDAPYGEAALAASGRGLLMAETRDTS